MLTEQNKALARRFLDGTAAGDGAALKKLLAPDFVAHQPGGPQNSQAFLQHLGDFRRAFSDNHFTVEEQVAEGDTVVTLTTWRATHTGEFQGLPPTGKQIAVQAVFIGRVEGDRLVESRSLFDQLSMMQQLGVMQTPEAAG